MIDDDDDGSNGGADDDDKMMMIMMMMMVSRQRPGSRSYNGTPRKQRAPGKQVGRGLSNHHSLGTCGWRRKDGGKDDDDHEPYKIRCTLKKGQCHCVKPLPLLTPPPPIIGSTNPTGESLPKATRHLSVDSTLPPPPKPRYWSTRKPCSRPPPNGAAPTVSPLTVTNFIYTASTSLRRWPFQRERHGERAFKGTTLLGI